MTEKLKVGLYWAASCGGCEITVLDIDEKILDVVAAADIVFWPVAMDTKYEDVERFPDGYMDVCFFNGGIRTEENEHMARLLRRKSKILVAFGSCAVEGGVPGLANVWGPDDILRTAYLESPSTPNPERVVPQPRVEVEGGELTLPRLLEKVRPLADIVDVDYYLPGCPPPPELVAAALDAIVSGNLPPKGSILAPTHTLCKDCPRNPSPGEEKPRIKEMPDIKRIYEVDEIDPEKCFLEQGLICMGPVTRSGCSARCINGNFPCTGCMGPLEGVRDIGAKMISTLGSILMLSRERELTEEEVDELAEKVKDYIGTFYMYGLARSYIGRWLR